MASRVSEARNKFFALPVHTFKLASPQAAQLNLFYRKIISSVALLEGPELRTHYLEDREENISQHQVGFKPTTSQLQGVCSAVVLQPLPKK